MSSLAYYHVPNSLIQYFAMLSHRDTHLPQNIARAALLLLVTLLSACTGLPRDIEPVKDFQVERYLGTWYEIARLDHRFERGLEQVSATYTLRDDGTVKVVNRGWDVEEKEWSEVEGRAKFVEDPETGYLKVSFFGPFYATYAVFDLDAAYEQSFVTGNSRSYLWFLSRTRTVDDASMQRFRRVANAQGFDLEGLIIVNQRAALAKMPDDGS